MNEEKVLEKLNAVSTAKRLANMVRLSGPVPSALPALSPYLRPNPSPFSLRFHSSEHGIAFPLSSRGLRVLSRTVIPRLPPIQLVSGQAARSYLWHDIARTSSDRAVPTTKVCLN